MGDLKGQRPVDRQDQLARRRVFLDPIEGREGHENILVAGHGKAEKIGAPGHSGRIQKVRFAKLLPQPALEIENGQGMVMEAVFAVELEGVGDDPVRTQHGRAYAPVTGQTEAIDIHAVVVEHVEIRIGRRDDHLAARGDGNGHRVSQLARPLALPSEPKQEFPIGAELLYAGVLVVEDEEVPPSIFGNAHGTHELIIRVLRFQLPDLPDQGEPGYRLLGSRHQVMDVADAVADLGRVCFLLPASQAR